MLSCIFQPQIFGLLNFEFHKFQTYELVLDPSIFLPIFRFYSFNHPIFFLQLNSIWISLFIPPSPSSPSIPPLLPILLPHPQSLPCIPLGSKSIRKSLTQSYFGSNRFTAWYAFHRVLPTYIIFH